MLCPLDYRYGRKEMKEVFSEENRLRTQLMVEAALARAHAAVGNIPQKAALEITKVSTLEYVKMDRVKEIEEETKHDVMSVVKAISEQCGEASKYVHLGATSNDIVDTGSAIELKNALDILDESVDKLIGTFIVQSTKYRNTIMVGRTHGQFAIPTTFGFKLAGYLDEMLRHKERLTEVRKRICVGKMSGAIGTGAGLGPKFFTIQEMVMEDLGLGIEEAATQIVCRDRYAEFICVLSIIATSCERYATEVRNLQRSEIQEVMEAFDAKKQVGSSTMAQKKNPMLSENVCGLARIVRAFINPEMESMVLWHERDLTNSSAERFILPHVIVLTDDILAKINKVFSELVVFPENMKRNLGSAHGMIMAESVLLALASKGMGRQEAHEAVRQISIRAEEQGLDLMTALRGSEQVVEVLSDKELTAAMMPENYLGKAPEMVDRVATKAKKLLSSSD
jgi:adenylosuccinate lyase